MKQTGKGCPLTQPQHKKKNNMENKENNNANNILGKCVNNILDECRGKLKEAFDHAYNLIVGLVLENGGQVKIDEDDCVMATEISTPDWGDQKITEKAITAIRVTNGTNLEYRTGKNGKWKSVNDGNTMYVQTMSSILDGLDMYV